MIFESIWFKTSLIHNHWMWHITYLRDEPSDQNPFLPVNMSEDQIREFQKCHAALFIWCQVQVVGALLTRSQGVLWASAHLTVDSTNGTQSTLSNNKKPEEYPKQQSSCQQDTVFLTSAFKTNTSLNKILLLIYSVRLSSDYHFSNTNIVH